MHDCRLRLVAIVSLSVLVLSLVSRCPAAEAVKFADVIQEYQADTGSLERFYDLPWSKIRFEKLDALYGAWLEKLKSLDFNQLSHGEQVDYVLLRNSIEQSQAALARERKQLAQMDELTAFRETIYDLEVVRLRDGHLDGQATASKLGELTAQVKSLKERVEQGKNAAGKKNDAEKTAADSKKPEPARDDKPADKLPIVVSPAIGLRAGNAVGGMRRTLKSWLAFYDGFNPQLTWWLKKPCEEADKALEEYAALLKETIAGQRGKDQDPLVGDPIGAAAVAEEIRFEFLPYTAEELIAIGERQLAWGEGEMKKASQEMGLGDDWHAALAKVKSDYVPPGEQDELISGLGRDSIQFVKDHKFATIPPLCEETWHLTMMQPETLRHIPYAAYGGQRVMVAYANESMKQDDKLMVMRGNNRSFTRLTTIHELIPGHHLQMYNAARHNTQRGMFSTPFYVEGWALYCELQYWNLKWARTPQERIGMLFWRMNRATRIIVSLKFHLGQMKPDEMVDFMIQRNGHEKFGATSEVRRFISASPLYQAGYLLGGLQLMTLHDEMVGPGKLTDQQFHDGLLAENTMPIEMLRYDMRRLPLTRDTRPTWRFADEKK